MTLPRAGAGEILELVEKERCTSISASPTTLDKLRRHRDYHQRDLSSLRAQEVRPWLAPSSKGDPVNYGMTETFGPQFERRLFDYRIIDHETGETVPDGEVGEFIIRGFGLMQGLYKKEREEAFDADGFYHTGDRGYLEGERVFFTGRYSEMVKTAGANVSPLEVEQAMMSLPGVTSAYVFGVPHPVMGSEVVAIVVPEAGYDLDGEQIAVDLKRELSSYKIPKRIQIVSLDNVPLLASGKPDKRSMIATFEQAEALKI